jgi:hypothetical protein
MQKFKAHLNGHHVNSGVFSLTLTLSRWAREQQLGIVTFARIIRAAGHQRFAGLPGAYFLLRSVAVPATALFNVA